MVTTSGFQRLRADEVLKLVEPAGWNRRSAGDGAKGRRLYDWAWIALDDPRHHLIIRRSISDPTELAYYLAFVPEGYVCSLTDLVRVAGTRWAIEDDFQDSKQAVALDRTRYAPTGLGNGTSPSPWPPTPCWRSLLRRPEPRTRPRSCPSTPTRLRPETVARSR